MRRKICEAAVEVLIKDARISAWGDEEKTHWALSLYPAPGPAPLSTELLWTLLTSQLSCITWLLLACWRLSCTLVISFFLWFDPIKTASCSKQKRLRASHGTSWTNNRSHLYSTQITKMNGRQQRSRHRPPSLPMGWLLCLWPWRKESSFDGGKYKGKTKPTNRHQKCNKPPNTLGSE